MSRAAPASFSPSPARRERRMQAAIASGGTSGGPIYRAVLAAAGSLGIAGDALDFGAGTGVLIDALLASDLNVTLTGADLLTRPASMPAQVRWIQADLNEPLPLPDGRFDAITAIEVIEHLENPRAVFREFHRLLRPRGALLVTTPNQESLRALTSLLIRGHFVEFLDGSYPAHITALVRKDLDRIAVETGFERPRFLYTNDGGVPRFPAMTWQNLSLGLLRGRLFSDNILALTHRDDASC
jgi:2-polyprenyl-3-methyl-5-hydroxy-6-metoxy-1,4-benzoquinol methylase